MKIETERLLLKAINETNADDILKIRGNKVINQFVQRVSPKSNYEALNFILNIKRKTENKEVVFWGISYKDEPNLLGTICFWNFSEDRKVAEIGYELLPDYHRKGIMSEAMSAVIEYGFNTLALQEIVALTNRFNENSKGLLSKHHFVLEKDRKDEEYPNNIVFILKNNG